MFVWMADGPGDLDFPLDGQLFTAGEYSVISDCTVVTLRFRGELDVPALERATNALLSRRGISRDDPAESGELPFPGINDTVKVFVEEHDVDDINDALLAERLECSVNDPFQVRLYHRVSGETLMLAVTHQSVADFWSITAFIRELETLYSELTGGPSERLPELADFTRYYSWVDGSRVSTRAVLDPDESSDVSAVP